jgi:hypothetical protein
MRNALSLSTLSADLRKHWDHAQVKCGFASCSRKKAWWHQILAHRSGTFLDGSFYCSAACLEATLATQLSRLASQTPSHPPASRIPLGLLMVARGRLTYEQVTQALAAQQSAGSGKIGDWFENLGFATEPEVTSALALQWGCPVAASLDSAISPDERIPLPILEAFQMLPLRRVQSTNTLCLAFGERVDYAALYTIGTVMECATQPCVAGRKTVARELERLRHQARSDELEFGPIQDVAEMTRISVSYILRLGADRARIGRVGPFIWLRMRGRKSHTNVIFRIRKEPARPELIVTGCA